MFATIMSDPIVMPTQAPEPQPPSNTILQTELKFANCDCCGLTEECTQGYIEKIRETYHGKWLCGLCAEAVKDEIIETNNDGDNDNDNDIVNINTEKALNKHMSFCKNFISSSPPPNSAVHLISAMRRILRRSLDSPRGLRSTPSSPTNASAGIRRSSLIRSESCFPELSG